MRDLLFADTYPIRSLELPKSQTPHQNIDSLLRALEAEAEADPGVALISVFDHHAHTLLVGGEIRADILAARNLIFCFGPKLPDPAMLALRPRSIGIAELPDRFVIVFMKAPMAEANCKMSAWVEALRTPMGAAEQPA